VKLTVLGCSGSMPGPDSPASSYLIEQDGFRVVMDLGNGGFGALQRYVDPRSVDAVLVSHLHADHCIDFTGYLVALRYGPDRPTRRIPVYGPAGIRDRLEAAYDPLARDLGLHELFDFATPRPGALGPFELALATMNHPVRTYGISLSAGGRTLVYSADTGETPELVRLATGADVLLCEASFGPDDPYVPNLHLTGKQAGQHAARADVGKLIVTHVPPWGDPEREAGEAATAYKGPIEVARAGAQYEI
jgi:ribonuclease BN (tRNA processing enzyme)